MAWQFLRTFLLIPLKGMEPRFGLGLLPSDFMSDRIVPRPNWHHLPTGYRRPWALARDAMKEMNKDEKNLHFGKFPRAWENL